MLSISCSISSAKKLEPKRIEKKKKKIEKKPGKKLQMKIKEGK